MNDRTKGFSVFFIAVFLAGFSFLIFEISWFRMISLVIGSTVSASTIVLAAFMLGFGLGGNYLGKKVLLNPDPSRFLFYLFLIIASLGLIDFYLIKYWLPSLYNLMNDLPVFLIAALLLIIPAFFMGGVLPVISKIIIRSDVGLSHILGKLYAFETIGSAIGGLLTGFVLIGHIGQKNTILLAVLVNILLSVIVLFSKKANSPETLAADSGKPNDSKAVKQKKGVKTASDIRLNKKTALLAAFVCGFAVVGLQVVWMRIFRIYMTNTSYSFSLIASMVILGLFAGSWLYMKKGAHIKLQIFTVLKLLFYLGFFILLGLLLLVKLPELLFFPFSNLQNAHFLRIIVIPFLSSVLIVLPVTVLSGYIFPLACNMYTEDYKRISHNIGKVLFYNTLGSVIGPLCAAYILIPFFGAGLTILFIVLVLIIFAYIISLDVQKLRKVGLQKILLLGFGLIIIAILIFRPHIYFLPPSFVKYQKKILAYKETVEGTYIVGQESDGYNTVLSTYVNNSSVIGSTYDAIKAVKMVGHIPFFAGLQCKDALIIGFGIGVTASAIASHPEVRSLDCVELVAGLKNAANFYSDLNSNIEKDARVKIFSGDGRHYLQSTSKKYDLISSDPTHPILGSANIYSKEYFELCKKQLNKGGFVSQYLPLHKLLLKDFLGIIKTFHSVFPDATVWLGHYHAILIGSNGAGKIDFAKWSEKISGTAKDIYFYSEPHHLAACLVLDSAAIEKIPKDIKINTDDLPYTEFFAMSSFNSDNLTMNLQYLNQNRCGLDNVFYNMDDKNKMARFVKGNKLLTEGLYYFLQGNKNEFLKKLQTACKENPEDEEFPFLIKFHFR
jgi:spermidine synthase